MRKKIIICARCGNPADLHGQAKECPHPKVKNKIGKYICVYCCKSCKHCYMQGTGFKCKLQDKKQEE